MSNGGVSAAQASDAEKANYLLSLVKARSGLVRATNLLIGIMNSTEDPQTTRAVGVQIDELDARLNAIDRDLNAFAAGEVVIQPPSHEDVDAMEAALVELDTLTAAAESRSRVVDVVTRLLGLMGKRAQA